LARRGVVAVVAVRIVPIAPFTIVNLVAGASHIAFREYALGTALAMTPGVLAMSLFADRVTAAMRSPSAASYAVLAALVIALLARARWIRRRLDRERMASGERAERAPRDGCEPRSRVVLGSRRAVRHSSARGWMPESSRARTGGSDRRGHLTIASYN